MPPPATSRCWWTAASSDIIYTNLITGVAWQLSPRQPVQCGTGPGQFACQRPVNHEFRQRADQGVERYLGLRPGHRRRKGRGAGGGVGRTARTRIRRRTHAIGPVRPDRRVTGFVLTRALLEAGGVDAMVARSAPGMRLLTEEERAQSLRETLALRPPGEPVWLFGYGSLIWNPQIHAVERRVAIVARVASCVLPFNPGRARVAGQSQGSCSGWMSAAVVVELHSVSPMNWWRPNCLCYGGGRCWLGAMCHDGSIWKTGTGRGSAPPSHSRSIR